MNIDADRETTDEEKRSRRTLHPLASAIQPRARPPSAESVEPDEPWAGNVPHGPKKEAKEKAPGTSLLPAWLRRLGYYGLALLLVAAAALLRWLLPGLLRPAPFLAFYVAWVGAAVFGGLGPGLLATLLSWLCIDFFFDPTPGRLDFMGLESIDRLLVFLAGGVVIGVVGEQRRRSRLRERRRGRELAAANAALRSSQSMLRSVMENVPQGIFWKDRHSTYLGCNNVFARAVGLESAGEIVGKTDHDLPWSPEQTASFREYDRRIMENDAPEYHIIEQQREANGKLAWLETSKVPLHDARGNVIGILGTYEDITERKQAEQDLRESRNKYQALIETTADFIWEMDTSGKYTYCSPQMKDLWGYEPKDMIGRTPFDVMPPADRRQAIESFLSLAKSPQPFMGLEASSYDSRGRLIAVEISGVPFFDADGRLLGYRGISRDVTERKRAEETLREWNVTLESRVAERTEELEQRARELQKLTLELTAAEERERKRLAEILHDDLQQVLAAAKFQAGLLSSRVKNDAEAQEITGQVKDLLTDAIAKSRSLSHELSAPALSQRDLGEAFEWLAQQMQTKHGLTVHLEMCERIELASEPRRVLLYKAAQEALFNVIKHAGVHEAKLRLRRQHGCIRLSVSDQGRGFDPTESGCKLGFGLLSIRERVASLGGRLKIRSAPGRGSTFLLVVPDAEGSA
jgi:PAS domain S-box-containing protein